MKIQEYTRYFEGIPSILIFNVIKFHQNSDKLFTKLHEKYTTIHKFSTTQKKSPQNSPKSILFHTVTVNFILFMTLKTKSWTPYFPGIPYWVLTLYQNLNYGKAIRWVRQGCSSSSFQLGQIWMEQHAIYHIAQYNITSPVISQS